MAPSGRQVERRPRRWRPSATVWAATVAALLGLAALIYPTAMSWRASLEQARTVSVYVDQIAAAAADPADNASGSPATTPSEQLASARAYNEALIPGATLAPRARTPRGDGRWAGPAQPYNSELATPGGVMSRLRIPKIGVDLPVFHGAGDRALFDGVGHLEGSSLPVGGPGAHSVMTAYRGLAEATMFTALDQVEVGDRITINTFGKVLSYEVRSTRAIEPRERLTLRARPGHDLVTLVTSTPRGVIGQRIVVTGERVRPTPAGEAEGVTGPGRAPFPGWVVVGSFGVLGAGVYCWRAGLRNPLSGGDSAAVSKVRRRR